MPSPSVMTSPRRRYFTGGAARMRRFGSLTPGTLGVPGSYGGGTVPRPPMRAGSNMPPGRDGRPCGGSEIRAARGALLCAFGAVDFFGGLVADFGQRMHPVVRF